MTDSWGLVGLTVAAIREELVIGVERQQFGHASGQQARCGPCQAIAVGILTNWLMKIGLAVILGTPRFWGPLVMRLNPMAIAIAVAVLR